VVEEEKGVSKGKCEKRRGTRGEGGEDRVGRRLLLSSSGFIFLFRSSPGKERKTKKKLMQKERTPKG